VRPPKKVGNTRLAMSAPKNGNGNGNTTIYISIAAGIIVALLQAFWGVAWSGVNANIDRLEKQIIARTRELEAIRIREHERIENQLSARLALVEKDFLRLQEHREFTVRLDSQISKMEARIGLAATHEEVDTRLGINSTSIIQVRNEIGELKRDLGQTYPLKEVLGNLTSRIDRMEQWSRAPPPHQAPAK